MQSTHQRWRAVPGWEGLYKVSDTGDVYSVRSRRNLTPRSLAADKHLRVALCRSGYREDWLVHRLVLVAFVGRPPAGMEGCHNNGVPADNRLGNLRWDTRRANVKDQVSHGVHPHGSRSHCKRGHEFTAENIYNHGGKRHCRTCRQMRERGEIGATSGH